MKTAAAAVLLIGAVVVGRQGNFTTELLPTDITTVKTVTNMTYSGAIDVLMFVETNDWIQPALASYQAYTIEDMRVHGVTNIVKTLAEAGEICAVYGHWWPSAWVGERKCQICGIIHKEQR
jgi:hypothetical protein